MWFLEGTCFHVIKLGLSLSIADIESSVDSIALNYPEKYLLGTSYLISPLLSSAYDECSYVTYAIIILMFDNCAFTLPYFPTTFVSFSFTVYNISSQYSPVSRCFYSNTNNLLGSVSMHWVSVLTERPAASRWSDSYGGYWLAYRDGAMHPRPSITQSSPLCVMMSTIQTQRRSLLFLSAWPTFVTENPHYPSLFVLLFVSLHSRYCSLYFFDQLNRDYVCKVKTNPRDSGLLDFLESFCVLRGNALIINSPSPVCMLLSLRVSSMGVEPEIERPPGPPSCWGCAPCGMSAPAPYSTPMTLASPSCRLFRSQRSQWSLFFLCEESQSQIFWTKIRGRAVVCEGKGRGEVPSGVGPRGGSAAVVGIWPNNRRVKVIGCQCGSREEGGAVSLLDVPLTMSTMAGRFHCISYVGQERKKGKRHLTFDHGSEGAEKERPRGCVYL